MYQPKMLKARFEKFSEEELHKYRDYLIDLRTNKPRLFSASELLELNAVEKVLFTKTAIFEHRANIVQLVRDRRRDNREWTDEEAKAYRYHMDILVAYAKANKSDDYIVSELAIANMDVSKPIKTTEP